MPEGYPSVQRELFVRRVAGMEMGGIDPPESFVNHLLLAARDVYFGAGETIYEEGAKADWFYMIRSGLVEARAGDEKPWTFADGAVGILDAIIGRPYKRTAVAIEPTTCLALHCDEYFAMLEDHVEFSHAVVRNQASRLHKIHRGLPNKQTRFSRPANWRLIRKDAEVLGMVERLIVLRQTPAFQRSSIQALVSLAKRSRSEKILDGTTLFQQGDISERIWVVADGRVAIESDGKRESLRGPGELIESYAAFGHVSRQYTATAVTPLVMVSVSEDDLFDRMEEHFELTRSVMGYLAQKWEQINLSLAARTGEFQGAGRG